MNTRKCPSCNIEILYSTKYTLARAIRKNNVCKTCSCKKTSEENKLKGKLKGKNNPNFGKTFSEKHKRKISENHWDSSGTKNAMFGKSFYECWVEKYGEEIADKKLTQFKNKQSENNKGNLNGMFGKPAPQGSGNGWSGWYKDWYFRSLGELSYVVNVLEPTNQHWVSAESTGIKILYIHWNGSKRTYIPDFLVNHDSLIECKPQKLHDSPLVQIKRQAAEQYCKNHGLTYQVVAPPKINTQWLIDAVDSELVKLLKPYELKLEDYRQS